MPENPETNGSRLDRIEGALDRLVATQADHDSAISKLAEAQQASSHLVNRVIGLVEALTGSVGQIADAQRLAEEKIGGLAQRMDGLAQRMEELAQAQKHSDERIDRVIDVVEDLIRPARSAPTRAVDWNCAWKSRGEWIPTRPDRTGA